jgi:hypothetical protein
MFGSVLIKLAWKLASGTLGKVIERALVMAQEVVRELDASNLDGPEKRAAAYARLKGRFAQEGIEVAAWILNYAIESTVAELRQALDSGTPLAPVPPTPPLPVKTALIGSRYVGRPGTIDRA